MRRLVISISIATVVVIAILLPGCAEPIPPKSKVEQAVTIGLILPLEGDFAVYGQLSKNAIDLAVDQANLNGGLLGKQIETVAGNDGAGDIIARNSAEQFIKIQSLPIIIGPYTTQSSLAAASVCQENSTPMIAIRASEPQVTKVGSYIFRACCVDAYQGTLLGRFAVDDLKVKTAMVVYNRDDRDCAELIDLFRKEIDSGGSKLVSTISYRGSPEDLSKITRKMADLKPDVVLLPDFEDNAASIMKDADRAGIKTVYLGTDLWNTEELFKLVGEACLGSYVSQHFSPDDPDSGVKSFVNLYRDEYGVKPGPSAALAYDAVNLAIEAIRNANSTDPKKIRTALDKTENFRGVTGKFVFDEARNPIKGGTIVKIVEDGEKFEKRIEP